MFYCSSSESISFRAPPTIAGPAILLTILRKRISSAIRICIITVIWHGTGVALYMESKITGPKTSSGMDADGIDVVLHLAAPMILWCLKCKDCTLRNLDTVWLLITRIYILNQFSGKGWLLLPCQWNHKPFSQCPVVQYETWPANSRTCLHLEMLH